MKEKFERKNENFECFFSLFGQLYEVVYFKTYTLVKYSSLKSLKKLEKCLQNFTTDPKSQLKFLKNIFMNISEDSIKHLLCKVLILNKDNSNDFFLQMETENYFSISSSNYSEDYDKENQPPSYSYQNVPNHKNNLIAIKKKPLKLTSKVFSLSEIPSVNDANNCITMQQKYSETQNINGERLNFQIELDTIKNGLEKRTTIMIRNIPNRYNQEALLKVIDVKFKGMYDFVYLPMDFRVITQLFID